MMLHTDWLYQDSDCKALIKITRGNGRASSVLSYEWVGKPWDLAQISPFDLEKYYADTIPWKLKLIEHQIVRDVGVYCRSDNYWRIAWRVWPLMHIWRVKQAARLAGCRFIATLAIWNLAKSEPYTVPSFVWIRNRWVKPKRIEESGEVGGRYP